ncbi:OLC1v1007387C1 [Oldenlandia corymbosa var. corymbosa]|uniref:OLC1v1007387C1 n=1 Tax=Oldenlandia corymbosa var. corymbosa TaxID=529605 RepID=A0AAV1DJ56_OLDCO|nr:OLC1v1007387C1 [Oldenlandia corymbosa var. corymbosa]
MSVDSPPHGENNCPHGDKNKAIMKMLFYHKCRKPSIRVIHSVKVGISLVLVSLLYLLDPLFEDIGENAMWAIMTVVVVFEFTAGATLSKGINRAIGTILGGGLGCLAAILGDKFEGTGNAIIVGTSVFIIGAAATYSRLVPRIKRRYDYGCMIFILTFNLVAVSGVRADKVVALAKVRLSTIGMGFAVCIFISLLVFPIWASDQLHDSTASKFEKLASCISECLEEYFSIPNKEENKPKKADVSGCKAVFHSKSTDESLANFAKWEPWHGKFGLSYPWEKYLEIGETLRELAALILSLRVCIQSSKQPELDQRDAIKEGCELAGLSMVWILRELGESILTMKQCRSKTTITPKLQTIKLELSKLTLLPMPMNKGLKDYKDETHHLGTSSFIFLLMEITHKIEDVADRVEQLGQIASFQAKTMDV